MVINNPIATIDNYDLEPSRWHLHASKRMQWQQPHSMDWLASARGYDVLSGGGAQTVVLGRVRQLWASILMLSCVSIVLVVYAGSSTSKFNSSIAIDVLLWVVAPINIGAFLMLYLRGDIPRKYLRFDPGTAAVAYRGSLNPNAFCLFIRDSTGDHLLLLGRVSRQSDCLRVRPILESVSSVVPISPEIVYIDNTPFAGPRPNTMVVKSSSHAHGRQDSAPPPAGGSA